MSKARRKSRGSRGSLEDDEEIAALPWRPFVVLLKPTDGAKKSVDAALATLAPLSDQDVAGTRVELVAKSQLSSGGGKLSKALAAKIQRDRRQGLRDRLDQEQERLKALKKARKEREKRKSRGDILDDESELSSVNPITQEREARGAPDIVYVLKDFPSSKDEADDLISNENVLDAIVTIVQNEDGGSGGGIAYPHSKPQLAFDILPLANLDHDEDNESASQTVPLVAAKIGKAHKESRDAQCLTDPLKKPPQLVKALYDAQREKQDAWNDVAFLEIALTPVEAAKSPQGGGGSFDDHKKKEEEAARKALEAAKKWLFDITEQLTAFGCGHCAFKSYVRQVVSLDVPSEDREKIKSTQRACDAVCPSRDAFYGSGLQSRPGTASSTLSRTSKTPWELCGRRQRYAELASNVPEAACTCGVLLYCMLEAVVTGGDAPRSDDDPPAASPLAALLPHASSVLPIATTPERAEAALSGDFEASDLTFDSHDVSGLRLARAEQRRTSDECLGSRLLLALDRAAHHKLNLIQGGRDRIPINDKEGEEGRAIKRTELQAFTTYSPNDVDNYRQRCVFDELLENAFVEETVDGRIASTHDRTVAEKISSYSLQQVLKSEHADESTFLQSYYAPTDELLLIAHQPTARGRCGQVVWDPTLGARPSYANWHATAKRSDDKIDVHDNGFRTPRSTAARTARVVPPSLAQLQTHTTLLYPADHSLVRLRTMGEAYGWLSVRKNGTVFGLRARDDGANAARRAKGLSVQQTDGDGFAADFACEFTDGARVTAVKETSVVLRSTDVSGLTVDVGCDGSVRMRHVGVGPGAPLCVSEEKERVVCGGGVVVRRLRDGSAQLLFADGSVATAASDATADDLEWSLLEGACVKDAATGARVWLQGATSLTIFEDGVVLAKHADGTIIRTCEHHVVVECPGLAAVEIDTDIDATATAHAQGHQVAVAKGGERIRCRVALPDGSRVVATYDTSVTATVRGRLALLRPDRTEILAQDDGLVTLRPPELYQGGSVKARGEHHPYGLLAPWCEAHDDDESDDEAKSEPDTTAGAYRFDCVAGSMSLEDPEYNIFKAHLCGKQAGDVEVELAGVSAGVKAEAVVNSPVAPRCFCIGRDGSAVELLRDSDVIGLRRDVEARKVLPVAFGRSADPHATEDHCLDDCDRKGGVSSALTSYEVLSASSLFESTFGTGRRWTAYPPPPSALVDAPSQPLSTVKPTVRVSRVLVETPSTTEEDRASIQDALKRCDEWRREREVTIDRFAVDDPRNDATLQNERAVQKRLKLAYKAARQARRRRAKRREQERMSRESRESVSTRASTPAFSSDGMSDVGTHTETMTIGSFSDSEAPPPEDSPNTAFAREVFVGQVLEAIEEQEEAARLYAMAPAPAAIACAPAPALAPAPAPAPASLMEDSLMSETEGDTKTVEAPPPFDPSRDGSLGVERCRAALVEILGRNVTEESIASKMEDDERDPAQISFGDFRWLLSECENDFDMMDEAEEEAKRLRDEEAEQRRRDYEDEVQERSKERGPQARGLLPMGAFWETEDGKELMATLPPYEGRKKTREDMRKASTDPTPVSKLAQQLEAEMYARLEAQKNAPAPAPEIPDSPLPAGSAVQAVKKRTKRRDPPPLTVQPQVCEIPSAALGCVYDIPLAITVRPGGKVRIDVSSKSLRVVERPRHSIAPGETEQAIIEYTAGSQGPIQEFVDVLAQFGTVRVPIVGWVDAPQGGPCSPSTVTES